MITPADLARMLDHASVRHARDPLAPDELKYSTSTAQPAATRPPSDAEGVTDTADIADENQSDTPNALRDALKNAAFVSTQLSSQIDTSIGSQIGSQIMVEFAATATRPSPANMPPRRSSDGPTTFASLDAQELPVVREYSAGGLVFDERGRVAIIARHSRSGHLEWCLPKGHIEKGETPQQTAVREVHEETGILGEVVDSIATIDYWFTGASQRVHKLVHHFALRQIGGELTVEGDPDHEAEDAIWVDFQDLDGVLSYPNERKIAWLYARKLNRQA